MRRARKGLASGDLVRNGTTGEAILGQDSPGYDPVADLLFSLVAVLLIVILAKLPAIENARPRTAQEFMRTRVFHEGAPLAPILADAEGLRLPSGGAVALDSIVGDARVAAFLRTAAKNHETILEVVTPRGSEASFELENLMAELDPAPLLQIRLGPNCLVKTSEANFDLCERSRDGRHG